MQGRVNRDLILVIVLLVLIIGIQQAIIAKLRHPAMQDLKQYQSEAANATIPDLKEEAHHLTDWSYLLNDVNITRVSDNESTTQEAQDTLRAIDEYHAEIRKRMAWFKNNAVLEETPFPASDPRNAENMERALALNCIKRQDGACIISMGCIADMNKQQFSIRYISDDERRTKENWDTADRLHSINETLQEGGGDCDDYSIFVKAEANYLKTACGTSPAMIQAWTNEDNSNVLRNTEAEGDRQEDAAPYPTYPSMVCGTFDGGKSGHCVLAFTSKPIAAADDIPYLENADLVEPQTGEAMGKISAKGNISLGSEVWVVSSDYDLLFYSAAKQRWLDDNSFDRQLMNERRRMAPLQR